MLTIFSENSEIADHYIFRVLGSLVSAHLLIEDPKKPFGDLRPDDYDNGLLSLAHDLAGRLMSAFENTPSGIPYPRVRQ